MKKFLPLLVLVGTAAAAQNVLPQFGIAPSGDCRALQVRDVTLHSNVTMGCIRSDTGFEAPEATSAVVAPTRISQPWIASGTLGKFGRSWEFTATSATNFEIGHQVLLSSSLGVANPYSAGKIGLFVGAFAHPGSAAIYAENLLVSADAGVGDVLITGSELNVNNNAGNYGEGETGFLSTLGVGYFANSGGPYRLTAGFLVRGTSVGGPGGNPVIGSPIWNVAYGAYGNSVARSFLQDDTNSPTLFRANGNHNSGLEWSNVTGMTTWAYVPNNTTLAVNRSNGMPAEMLRLDTDNILRVGNGANSVSFITPITLLEITTPATPVTGSQVLYIDSVDHKLKRKDSSGTVTIIG